MSLYPSLTSSAESQCDNCPHLEQAPDELVALSAHHDPSHSRTRLMQIGIIKDIDINARLADHRLEGIRQANGEARELHNAYLIEVKSVEAMICELCEAHRNKTAAVLPQ